ncbi:hypothetical protein WJX84_003757 [Apatococcus fuscideae]|uniref:Uncharacterized protein n=1 Tax=Apatococcus fuscideae TaxID=2026836 RepID=A0AAW1T2Q5_9CHLO
MGHDVADSTAGSSSWPLQPSIHVVLEWIKKDLAELEAFLVSHSNLPPDVPPDMDDVRETACQGLTEPFAIARESFEEHQDLQRLYSWSAALPRGMRLLLIAHAPITGVEPAFQLDPNMQLYLEHSASLPLPIAIQAMENMYCKARAHLLAAATPSSSVQRVSVSTTSHPCYQCPPHQAEATLCCL